MKHYIGSGGKARKGPNSVQRQFTLDGPVVIPTQVQGWTHDTRIQCSPAEVEELKTTGFYSKQFRQLRGKA